MATRRRSLDINSAFKFAFQQKDWPTKFLVAGLLSITIIMTPAVLGWTLEIARDVIKGKKAKLPEWDHIGKNWSDGFACMIAIFIWLSPTYLLFCAFYWPFITQDPAVLRDSNLSLQTFSLQIVSGVFTLLSFLIQPIAFGLFADTGSIAKTLQFRLGLRLFRANWKQFLGAGFLGYVASYAATLAGMFLLCIGLLFTAPIGNVIMFHLYAQAYRNAKALIRYQRG